jgi:hypothetical protein
MQIKREIRKVPSWWQHPMTRNWRGHDEFVPLFRNTWKEQCERIGKEFSQSGGVTIQRTCEAEHTPEFTDAEKTHYQMYETETAGTPISPVFPTTDEMIAWLVDNRVGYFAGHPGTRDDWCNLVATATLNACDNRC